MSYKGQDSARYDAPPGRVEQVEKPPEPSRYSTKRHHHLGELDNSRHDKERKQSQSRVCLHTHHHHYWIRSTQIKSQGGCDLIQHRQQQQQANIHEQQGHNPLNRQTYLRTKKQDFPVDLRLNTSGNSSLTLCEPDVDTISISLKSRKQTRRAASKEEQADLLKEGAETQMKQVQTKKKEKPQEIDTENILMLQIPGKFPSFQDDVDGGIEHPLGSPNYGLGLVWNTAANTAANAVELMLFYAFRLLIAYWRVVEPVFDWRSDYWLRHSQSQATIVDSVVLIMALPLALLLSIALVQGMNIGFLVASYIKTEIGAVVHQEELFVW